MGFDAVGITHAGPVDPEQTRHMSAWLDAGFAAQMHYMQRNLDKRLEPSKLLKGAKSVMVAALNYKPREVSPERAGTGRVANYALYEDYHRFIKQRLGKLTDFIASVADGDIRFKMCVDSAPVAERALAVRAGLGFVAKNHMLTIPKLGQEVFLAEIITTLKLEPDTPASGSCSECSRCIDACPTGALRADGFLDANKCISYLTIEHKGDIPPNVTGLIGDRLFGCDECVEACPYRQDAPACSNKEIKFYPERARIDLKQIQTTMTEEQFQIRFAGSPLERLGLERLQRNAEICRKSQPTVEKESEA